MIQCYRGGGRLAGLVGQLAGWLSDDVPLKGRQHWKFSQRFSERFLTFDGGFLLLSDVAMQIERNANTWPAECQRSYARLGLMPRKVVCQLIPGEGKHHSAINRQILERCTRFTQDSCTLKKEGTHISTVNTSPFLYIYIFTLKL